MKLGVVEFGRALIEAGDLDPLYIALWGAEMPRPQLCRWLVAYWCYYHAGLCCWLSEQSKFWAVMGKVAASKDYPRGTERRHFRGATAVKSVAKLRETFSTAEQMVDWLVEGGPTAKGVCSRVLTLYGFGEWVKWKVPDMLERLGIAPIQFTVDDLPLMFTSSKQGAIQVCETYGLGESSLLKGHRYLMRKLGLLKAPPLYDRRINVQETETIFCKWHSHLNGHYPPGKDCRDLREGLERYKCTTSTLLLGHLPTPGAKI